MVRGYTDKEIEAWNRAAKAPWWKQLGEVFVGIFAVPLAWGALFVLGTVGTILWVRAFVWLVNWAITL